MATLADLCALLEQLGRDPRHVDEERLRAGYPGAETLRLPGSGLVVTLGELNVRFGVPSPDIEALRNG